MTMIMGLNLSDRLYLAADTRVTFGDGTTCDNALKILPLLDRTIHKTDKTIVLAIAGDVNFAAHLYKKIHESLNKGELNPDIREFYKEIYDFLYKVTNEWDELNSYRSDVALLFSGICCSRDKKVDKAKLAELVKMYEEKAQKSKTSEFRRDLDNLVITDPIFKIINEKMKKEAGMSVAENLALSDTPKIPEYIQKALDEEKEHIPGCPDSLIFSAWVTSPNPKTEIKMETAEWGEFLTYGDSVDKSTVAEELMATLEMSPGREKNAPHLLDSAIMTTTILDIARDKGIKSIGGTVIIVPSDKDGEKITGKDIVFQPGNTGVKVNGKFIPLVPFDKYSQWANKQGHLEM